MIVATSYSLLLLVAALSTALGAVVKREASECLYQFVTQPPEEILEVCNPFEQQNSLALECSILVSDNVPGEVTIEWMFKEQLNNREFVLSTTTTAHSQGDTIVSTFTVPTTEMGEYFCQPTSSRAGPLGTSTKTEVLNRALYFGRRSCTGLNVNTEQPRCVLLSSLEGPTNSTESEELTTQTTQPETRPTHTPSTTSAPQPANSTTDPQLPSSFPLYMALGGMGLVIVILVMCVLVLACCCCCYRRTSERKKPKSKGHGSRVVRDWHAVNTRTNSTEQEQTSPRYSRAHYVSAAAPSPPPYTHPPVLAATEQRARYVCSQGPNEFTNSQQYNDYSLNWVQSYKDDRLEWMESNRMSSASLGVTNRVSVERVLSNEPTQSPATEQSSAGTEQHSYVNYPRVSNSPNDTNLEFTQERGNSATSRNERHSKEQKDRKDVRNGLKGPISLPVASKAQEEVAYSVVGSIGHIYQGLVPQTIDYLSLYHTVNDTSKVASNQT